MLFTLVIFQVYFLFLNALLLNDHQLYSWLPSANTENSLGARQIDDIDTLTFKNVLNAKSLYLWGNRLTQIKRSYFNMTSPSLLLQVLDLSFNQIDLIEAKSFYTTSMRFSLKRLYLDNNSLTSLNANIFNGLTQLEHLYLYKNKLNSLDRSIFMGLSMLRFLYVQNNPISVILPDYIKRLCSTHLNCSVIV